MLRTARTLLSSAFLLAGTIAAGAQTLELNAGHVLTTASHYHAAAAKLAELVSEKSKGQIKINVFPAAQLGGEVKMIQSVRTGTQDIVVTGEAPLENTVKDYTVFSFPYLFCPACCPSTEWWAWALSRPWSATSSPTAG